MANHAHITQPSQLKAFRSNPWHEARAALECEIEKLIALLDEIDGDSDLEPDTDREPSLGWCGHGVGSSRLDGGDDRESDESDFEPNGDDEPRLGWVEVGSKVFSC